MFVRLDNRIPSGLAMIAGVLMSLGQCNVCVQTENEWQALFISLNSQGFTLASVFAFIMQYLVQFSGLTMFAGGLLSYKNHVRSGKELVGLGTSVGIADLLLRASTGTLAVYGSTVVLVGLILAFFASRHIHGPHATYVEEVQKLFSLLKRKLTGKAQSRPSPKKVVQSQQQQQQKKIKHGFQHPKAGSKRRASRRLSGPYDVGYNKNRQGQAAGKKDSTVGEP